MTVEVDDIHDLESFVGSDRVDQTCSDDRRKCEVESVYPYVASGPKVERGMGLVSGIVTRGGQDGQGWEAKFRDGEVEEGWDGGKKVKREVEWKRR